MGIQETDWLQARHGHASFVTTRLLFSSDVLWICPWQEMMDGLSSLSLLLLLLIVLVVINDDDDDDDDDSDHVDDDDFYGVDDREK